MSNQENSQASGQVVVESIKQLFHSLIDLRQETRRLESERITSELSGKFDELARSVNAIIDFVERKASAWCVRFVDYDEVDVIFTQNTDIASYMKANWTMSLSDIYSKFFDNQEFVKVIIRHIAETAHEIIELMKQATDIYTRIAKLDGKIDQLYRDIKMLCPQQDP